MTVFSVLTVSAALAVFSSPAAATVGIDMISNGRYWWGGTWQHRPAHGSTGDCICLKGVDKDTGVKKGLCMKGLDFNDHIEEQFVPAPFNTDYPIDITIHGSDALWIDRFTVPTPSGQKDYGAHNTHGYCLSSDRDDTFDQYATRDYCARTLSINPNGNVYAYQTRAGHHSEGWLLDQTKRTCDMLYGRRRAMAEDYQNATGPTEPEEDAEVSMLEPDELDEDPAGSNPNQVHNGVDGQIVTVLHKAIKQLVTENTDVTDQQIDSLLNSAILIVEQIMEKKDRTEEVMDGSMDGQTGSSPLARRLGAW